MSVRRAGPGARLSTGRLRVDAARAIAKLREYQLADRHGWVLEAVRAAVASGATRIELRGDSNDVWLAWHGEPWAADDLPRLFDELVSPEARRGQHLRLLAAAINTALGCEPAWIDVTAVTAGGDAVRVRYTPDTLAVGDLDGDGVDDPDALRALAATPIIPPPGAPSPGMLVHLRRRAGMETLRYLARGANPPELAIAHDGCADVTVPMTIDGAAVGRAVHRRDVLRLPLGHDLDGFLAVLDPTAPRAGGRLATFEIAEHGVRLTSYPWIHEAAAAAARRDPPAPVPLRLFVDGPRMPTNVSRAEVRRDAHPIGAAETRGRELVEAAIEAVIRTLDDAAAPAADRARAGAAAIALLASVVAGDDLAGALAGLTGARRRLAERPLARNAVGQARPLLSPWRVAMVHTGREPFPADLAPWLGDVAWVPPGDPTGALFAGLGTDGRAAREHAARAREEVKARRRFYDHPPQDLRVTPRSPVRVRATLGAAVPGSCVPGEAFDGLTGEVCLLGDARPGHLLVLLEGRTLAALALDGLPGVQAVISSDAVTPTAHYRDVVHDAALDRVFAAAAAGALRAAEYLALAHGGTAAVEGFELGAPLTREEDARLVRAGLRRAAAIARPDAWTSPLVRAPVWPTTDGAWTSLDALTEQRAVGVVAPGEPALAPRGRVVIVATADEHAALARLIAPVPLVVYPAGALRPVLDRARDLATRLAASAGVALAIREDTWSGAIAPGAASRVLHHAGVEVVQLPLFPTHVPCTVALDGDDLIPLESWQGVRAAGGLAANDLGRWELELVRALARRLLGEPTPELVVAPAPDVLMMIALEPTPLETPVGRALGAALVAATTAPADLLGRELHAALCARPLVRVLDGDEPRSIDALLAMFVGAALPFVRPGTSPVGGGWHPILSDDAVAAAIARLAGRRARDATDEADQRRRVARRDARVVALRAQPPRPLEVPGAAHDVPLPSGLGEGRVAVGADQLAIEVLIERRPFVRLTDPQGLPLAAVIDIPLEHADSDAVALLPTSARRLVEDVTAAAPALLQRIAASAAPTLLEHPPTRRLLVRWLDGVSGGFPGRDVLLGARAFATVQGGHASVRDASRGLSVAVSSWHGQWLGPEQDPADDLDRAVLFVAEGPDGDELRKIIGSLARAAVVDVTPAAHKLQAGRAMARGLLPAPTVQGALPLLARRFAELGGDEGFGPGEIALVDRNTSCLWLHQGGAYVEELDLDVEPTVILAIEAADVIAARRSPAGVPAELRASLTRRAQQLAGKLVAAVLATTRPDALVPWLRVRLRRALLDHRLAPVEVAGVPLFETSAGAWLTWDQVEAQAALLGDVWYSGVDATAVPLDARRVILRLAPAEVPAGGAFLDVRLVDATDELAADALARANQTRTRVETLELTAAEQRAVLAVGRLDPRRGISGLVAALDPSASALRGLRAHRAGFPFDPVHDGCDWPTLAIVDDPELTPDRTWSRAAPDLAWVRLAARVRVASEEAIAGFAVAPADALVSMPVAPALYATLRTFAEEPHVVVRGVLWLADAADAGGLLRVRTARGPMTLAVAERVPLHGQLALFAPDVAPMEALLEELGRAAYPLLLRALRRRAATVPAAAAAHLAFGLNGGHVTADDLDLAADPTFARLVEDHLAGQVPRVQLSRPPAAPPPIPVPADRPPRAAHPLDPLAAALDDRFRRLGVVEMLGVEVTTGTTPIVGSGGGNLRLAGDHRLLHALAAALAAGHVSAPAAIDALLAHATTVLNTDLTSVTDASELRVLAALLGASA